MQVKLYKLARARSPFGLRPRVRSRDNVPGTHGLVLALALRAALATTLPFPVACRRTPADGSVGPGDGFADHHSAASEIDVGVRLRFASAPPLSSLGDSFSRRVALGDTRVSKSRSVVPATAIPQPLSMRRTTCTIDRYAAGHERDEDGDCNRVEIARLSS